MDSIVWKAAPVRALGPQSWLIRAVDHPQLSQRRAAAPRVRRNFLGSGMLCGAPRTPRAVLVEFCDSKARSSHSSATSVKVTAEGHFFRGALSQVLKGADNAQSYQARAQNCVWLFFSGKVFGIVCFSFWLAFPRISSGFSTMCLDFRAFPEFFLFFYCFSCVFLTFHVPRFFTGFPAFSSGFLFFHWFFPFVHYCSLIVQAFSLFSISFPCFFPSFSIGFP